MKTTFLGWFCSCASIAQQMFCSQKKSVQRLGVEQALSLVLTSTVSFGRGCYGTGQPQGTPGGAGLEASTAGHSCTALAQALGEELCETWQKEGLLGLLAFLLSLSSAHVPRASPSHGSGALCEPDPHPGAAPAALLFLTAWAGPVVLATVTGLMLSWPCQPGSLTVPPHLCALGWLPPEPPSPSLLGALGVGQGTALLPLAPLCPLFCGCWSLAAGASSVFTAYLQKALSWYFSIGSSQ